LTLFSVLGLYSIWFNHPPPHLLSTITLRTPHLFLPISFTFTSVRSAHPFTPLRFSLPLRARSAHLSSGCDETFSHRTLYHHAVPSHTTPSLIVPFTSVSSLVSEIPSSSSLPFDVPVHPCDVTLKLGFPLVSTLLPSLLLLSLLSDFSLRLTCTLFASIHARLFMTFSSLRLCSVSSHC
jgi:hypothetical protein